MFEGIVAHLLNKYLGKYIDDLDTEQLNVGIFSGTVHLTDLQLKPESLAALDLPIEVKQGCIAKMSIEIPWTSLYNDPVLVRLEEVLLLAGPAVDRKYDPERDKRLQRAQKKKRLEEAEIAPDSDMGDKPKGFLENLATTIINNVQISIQNVHIRYEDTVSSSSAISCGLVLQNLTAITTNSKWKATQIDSDAKSVFKNANNTVAEAKEKEEESTGDLRGKDACYLQSLHVDSNLEAAFEDTLYDDATANEYSAPFALLISKKLSELSDNQRHYAEKIINDALFKGLMNELTFHSKISIISSARRASIKQ